MTHQALYPRPSSGLARESRVEHMQGAFGEVNHAVLLPSLGRRTVCRGLLCASGLASLYSMPRASKQVETQLPGAFRTIRDLLLPACVNSYTLVKRRFFCCVSRTNRSNRRRLLKGLDRTNGEIPSGRSACKLPPGVCVISLDLRLGASEPYTSKRHAQLAGTLTCS